MPENFAPSVDRNALVEGFRPFSQPASIAGMLVGNDLDALLCACFLKARFGWDVLGTYDYSNLWCGLEPTVFIPMLTSGQILAVDLDIYHAGIPCLGHHIITLEPNDNLPGQRQALNPNLIRGISHRRFRHKYPLGAIHWLLWLLDSQPPTSTAEALIWLADSAFINAQSHNYRTNSADWITNFLQSKWLLQGWHAVDTLAFEELLQTKVLTILQNNPLARPVGQARSRHLGLSGWQCQWSAPHQQRQAILQLLNIIIQLTGWQTPGWPQRFWLLPGQRQRIPVSTLLHDCRAFGFAGYLANNRVFSFVFPYRDVINVTMELLEKK